MEIEIIKDSLWIFVYGMVGVFLVMGIITGVAVLMGRLGRQTGGNKRGRNREEGDAAV